MKVFSQETRDAFLVFLALLRNVTRDAAAGLYAVYRVFSRRWRGVSDLLVFRDWSI